MFRALARALAVNRLRARNDYLSYRKVFLANDFQHLRRSERIHVHVFGNFRHVTAICRLMKNDINIAQHVFSCVAITEIALHKFCIAIDPGRLAALVRIRFQIVENSYAPALPHEQIRDMRTDQTGAPSNQCVFHLWRVLTGQIRSRPSKSAQKCRVGKRSAYSYPSSNSVFLLIAIPSSGQIKVVERQLAHC